jgi:Bifunctional DNA primase/polymerase, N-terminal/Primase C terminal 1 (PriCT-1)
MSEVPASELGGKGCSDNSGGYSHWRPIYAERGITLIPCAANKVPLVKNPQKFGRGASAEIANKFSDAGAFGYYCGRGNGITVLDVDTTDERVLADAMSRHGPTPIVVRTGSGKFHALYRHNNERRCVRAWKGLPMDLLGAGLAIAPPSRVPKGEYQIIEGHFDDLDRLPIMRELEARLYNGSVGPRPRGDGSAMREGDGRNYQLWQRLMREAHHCDTYEQLLDRAHTLNEEFAGPMHQAEVAKIAKSAWAYTERGENRFGQHGVWFATPEANELITSSQDDFLLLSYLRANNGPDSTFWVADGLANTLGWRRQRLAAARNSLIQRGYLKRLRGANQYTGPALYRWLSAREKGVR